MDIQLDWLPGKGSLCQHADTVRFASSYKDAPLFFPVVIDRFCGLFIEVEQPCTLPVE